MSGDGVPVEAARRSAPPPPSPMDTRRFCDLFCKGSPGVAPSFRTNRLYSRRVQSKRPKWPWWCSTGNPRRPWGEAPAALFTKEAICHLVAVAKPLVVSFIYLETNVFYLRARGGAQERPAPTALRIVRRRHASPRVKHRDVTELLQIGILYMLIQRIYWSHRLRASACRPSVMYKKTRIFGILQVFYNISL